MLCVEVMKMTKSNHWRSYLHTDTKVGASSQFALVLYHKFHRSENVQIPKFMGSIEDGVR
jgi:hypothetical protein